MSLPAPTAHVLQYGTQRIAYELQRMARKTIAISVAPDLRVTVKAPLEAEPAQIEAHMQRRAGWIWKQQRRFERYSLEMPPRLYVSGETHRYLGKQYRLKVRPGDPARVELARNYLYVYTATSAAPDAVKALVNGWYQAQARRVFAARLAAVFPRFERLGLAYPAISIRSMKSSWGSCSPAKHISLNLKLLQVPVDYIDYVLIHELCHLQEHHHGKSFYQLLERMLPGWKEVKEKLDGFDFG